jgi:hypothetical protein
MGIIFMAKIRLREWHSKNLGTIYFSGKSHAIMLLRVGFCFKNRNFREFSSGQEAPKSFLDSGCNQAAE